MAAGGVGDASTGLERMHGELDIASARIGAKLKAEFGESTYRIWLAHLRPLELSGDGRVVLAVPTRFFRDWIKARFEIQAKA